MKAWTIRKPGGREELQMKEKEMPAVREGEIRIKVKAAGINRTDTLTRQNTNLKAPYPILGVEVSGIVVDNHSNSPHLSEGTRVAGLVNHGGYAEFVSMPADRAIVIPDNLSFEEAAAIPEVFLTAYQTLYWLGELKDKETVLIHAAGSGVGTAAIQLARQLSNATVIATAGQSEKLDRAKSLGASAVVNYKKDSFDQVVQDQTEGRGVDVILDFVGASYWDMNLASCALDARWVLIGTLGGAKIDSLSIGQLMMKRLSLKGTVLTPRSDDYKARLTHEFSKRALPLFNEGKLKPVIHSVIPFKNLPEAHRQMEENENIGKIILSIEEESV
ncbi:NAD(P)H-quinone oxidoreductase [Alkalibacterium olivapovliticus]|uniref:Putative PIG3 family NAD(P)H quinone oxidoreductase n=1 Tax=Alkalibacterium olivapovliticus TaxID=99907 RepID=A0A2T0WAS0_9LACT|nr:NAD(P)H-quinone oxidoreductase [Alkalibacterium olivapovliticus]PRY83624.1 putative PIG3 family NAD(P)H quinone oxidoreductase [Alkalibacterium olivapovliticus]